MANEKKDRTYLLALLLLLLSGFFAFLFFLPDTTSTTQGSAQKAAEEAKKFEQKVNRHLFQTSQQMELTQERARLEAAKLQNKGIQFVPGEDPEKTSHPFDISADDRAENLARQLGRDSKAPGVPKSPSELIQAELFEAQQSQAYSEDYKKAYAQQFIENARKAGYAVKLNDQYKVISIQPLRKPSVQYQLFDSKDGALQ